MRIILDEHRARFRKPTLCRFYVRRGLLDIRLHPIPNGTHGGRQVRSERFEFSRLVKRAAYKRADGRCEARGAIYGIEGGDVRCHAFIGPGNVKYDHWPLPAIDDGSDTLENCMAICPRCHKFKTANYDVPMQAKGRRIRRNNGPIEDRRKTRHPIPKRKAPWPSRKMESRSTFQKPRSE